MKSGRGVPVTVLTPNYAKKQALRTAKLAARSLDFFEKYLGINYPFKKLDLIGIFDFNAGGMENIAMIHLMVRKNKPYNFVNFQLLKLSTLHILYLPLYH